MIRRRTVTLLLSAGLLISCDAEAPPLPEDLYEKGWDQTTRSQRIQLLRSDLNEQLDALRTADAGTRRHRDTIADVTRTLSALRPDLTVTEDGKDEYRQLESQIEALTGDAN